MRAKHDTPPLTHFTDTRCHTTTDTIIHAKYENKTTRVTILINSENKTSHQVIDAENPKKHTTKPNTKNVKCPRAITANLAGLINTSLIYNYVAESPTQIP